MCRKKGSKSVSRKREETQVGVTHTQKKRICEIQSHNPQWATHKIFLVSLPPTGSRLPFMSPPMPPHSTRFSREQAIWGYKPGFGLLVAQGRGVGYKQHQSLFFPSTSCPSLCYNSPPSSWPSTSLSCDVCGMFMWPPVRFSRDHFIA